MSATEPRRRRCRLTRSLILGRPSRSTVTCPVRHTPSLLTFAPISSVSPGGWRADDVLHADRGRHGNYEAGALAQAWVAECGIPDPQEVTRVTFNGAPEFHYDDGRPAYGLPSVTEAAAE